MRPARALVCAVAVLLVGAGTEAVAALATTPQGLPDGPPVVLVATVAPGTSVAGVAGRADDGDADVRHVLAPLRRVSVEVDASEVGAETRRIDALPGVTSVTRAARRYVSAVPDDQFYAAQKNYLDAVNAPAAWDITHGSSGVKIGIVDTGIDMNHPDLKDKIAGTYIASPAEPTMKDDVGHGTFVAGVAAAETNNVEGVAGAGYDASLLIAKVDHRDDNAEQGYDIWTDDESNGIIWAADNGARIINISLGAEGTEPTEQAAVEYAQGKGVLIVAAAGNDTSATPNYPAAYPGVIGVGATDAAGHRADFSNYGSPVDLAAPGTGIVSTTVRTGSTFWPGAGDYDYGQGTSFSSPLVAGGAALLAARYPTASAGQLSAALVGSARGYECGDLGAGQVDFAAALAALDSGDVAPRLADTAGAGAAIYPVRDGYADTVTPTVVLSKPATLTMTVCNSAGAVVRTLSAPRGAGRSGFTWTGTNNGGAIVGAGSYSYRFTAFDSAGLRSATPAYRVTVSPKRLVTVSTTLTRRGSQVARVVRDAKCEKVVKSTLGRRLINSCVPGKSRTVQALYKFTLPSAMSYTSLAASVRGRSPSQPARITGRVARVRGGSTATATRTVRSARTKTYSLGTVSAAGLVSRGRIAQMLIGVTNRYTKRGNPSDLDLSRVSLRVTYRVLR